MSGISQRTLFFPGHYIMLTKDIIISISLYKYAFHKS